MTREEAIDVLKHNYPSSCFEDLCKAVDIAIKALSAQPETHEERTETHACDCISRQAAIDAVAEFLYYTSNFDGMQQGFDLSDWKWKMEGVLSDLPSAQPEPCEDAVSRQAAIDFIDAGHLCNPNEPRWSDNEVVNFLKSRPSAQPKIIRCKDCIHNNDCDIQYHAQAGDTFYCGAAERRTYGCR